MNLVKLAQLAFTCLHLILPTHAWPRPWKTSQDLAIQAGYHVIYSYSGLEPPSQLYDWIKQGKVGGIILFGANVDFAENADKQVATIVQSFQDAYVESPGHPNLPLLVMTDQEGGRVRRLPGGPDLSAKEVGQSSNPAQAATEAGQQAAAALAAANNNANLAPVLGVFRSPNDFLDEYQRSYGNTSQLVSECGSAFIKEQQSAGKIATAKHFPGLGAASASANTDLEPVTLDLTLKELHTIDMIPYVQTIADGVDMVMCSWAVYPAIDPKYPAGLSETVIENELRGRLGFRGVTITDAIEAGALKAFGDYANRGVLATAAGMDLLLASAQNVTAGQEVFNGLLAALQDGTLARDTFDKSTNRIVALRSKLIK